MSVTNQLNFLFHLPDHMWCPFREKGMWALYIEVPVWIFKTLPFLDWGGSVHDSIKCDNNNLLYLPLSFITSTQKFKILNLPLKLLLFHSYQQSNCYPDQLRYNSDNKPWGLFFKGPFWGAYIWRGFYTEGNLRFKIDWASLYSWKEIYHFSLFYFVFEGNSKYKPPGLIFGGAYTWRGLF